MESAVRKFQERIVDMMEEGLTMFHLSTGPEWAGLTIEQKCEATLQMWDAPRIERTPRTNKPPTDVRDLVDKL
jgi:hypothetical protein